MFIFRIVNCILCAVRYLLHLEVNKDLTKIYVQFVFLTVGVCHVSGCWFVL
jgi:hypothetical protein